MDAKLANEMNEAGTGFMSSLHKALSVFESHGYTENLVPCVDHFECRAGKIRLQVNDFQVDAMRRFENTSDPDDQAIMYAISSPTKNIKGIYVDSYGLYHDELSSEMLQRLTDRWSNSMSK